jgi:hypothetical protein
MRNAPYGDIEGGQRLGSLQASKAGTPMMQTSKVLFAQWDIPFEIGAQNRLRSATLWASTRTGWFERRVQARPEVEHDVV